VVVLAKDAEGSARLHKCLPVILLCSVAEAICRESANGMPNETGGVLVGCERLEGTLVSHCTGPGPRAIREPTFFQRDGEFVQTEVDRVHRDTSGHCDYVGEWHSHPAPVGPSPRDKRSMRWIGMNPRYARPNPIMLLARYGEPDWTVSAYRWYRGHLREVELHVVDTLP